MIHAFIDESGSPILHDGVYYVLAAIVCREEWLDSNIEKLNNIRNKWKLGQELKSSNISDSPRRTGILKDVTELNFTFAAMVINKSVLNADSGLRFKTSMYKYCQRKLFRKIYQGNDNLSVVCDSFGSSDFMSSFERYLNEHFPTTLFSNKEFKYSNPINHQLLQLSDFIGGTIRRMMDKGEKEEMQTILQGKYISIEEWPQQKDSISLAVADSLDEKIASHAYMEAIRHIENELDPVKKECYNYLAFDRYGDGEFVYGDEILKHLKDCNLISNERDRDWLMHNVIAPMRDNGAIIISSRDGYKIPESKNDMADFSKFVQEKTDPYLDRYQKIRENVYWGTQMEYDCLEDAPLLQKYIKMLRK